ncbi:hypothetical protein BpHYR1_047301 [Brachionus plicatilis]|uniref:Uncharacterized protein n=1 Tax=Brachionus plicatilis TaxID=10195 RepID=A0A3M7T0F2_BRAPC|nr:hypothetical protein BpHYR1_047301 [Brachionus plicatilis]
MCGSKFLMRCSEKYKVKKLPLYELQLPFIFKIYSIENKKINEKIFFCVHWLGDRSQSDRIN